MTEQVSSKTANFKMGFVAYDGDGKMIGKPWTFGIDQASSDK